MSTMSGKKLRLLVYLALGSALFWYGSFRTPVQAETVSKSESHERPGIDLRGQHKIHFADRAEFRLPAYPDQDWYSISIPSRWSKIQVHTAIAWYRIHFSLSAAEAARPYSLFIENIHSADESYLNGALIGRQGSLHNTKLNAFDLSRNYLIPGGLLKAGPNVIAIRVRGYVPYQGGIASGRIELGDYVKLEERRAWLNITGLLFVVIYVLGGLFFLLFYLRVFEIYRHLFFGLLSISLAFYYLFGLQISYELVADFDLVKKLELTFLCSTIVWWWLFGTSLFNRALLSHWNLPVLLGLPWVFVPLFVDQLDLVMQLLWYWRFMALGLLLISFVYLAWHAWHQHQVSQQIVLGLLIFLVTYLVDTYVLDISIWQTVQLSHLALLACHALLAGSLVKSFVNLKKDAELTVDRLKELSRLQGAFIENLTASLQAPVHQIFRQAQALNLSDSNPKQKYLQIQTRGQELITLLERVLFLSRIQSGEFLQSGQFAEPDVVSDFRLPDNIKSYRFATDAPIVRNLFQMISAWQINYKVSIVRQRGKSRLKLSISNRSQQKSGQPGINIVDQLHPNQNYKQIDLALLQELARLPKIHLLITKQSIEIEIELIESS